MTSNNGQVTMDIVTQESDDGSNIVRVRAYGDTNAEYVKLVVRKEMLEDEDKLAGVLTDMMHAAGDN